ncbi:MAG: sensor histidine kinase [Burkholderia sp.]
MTLSSTDPRTALLRERAACYAAEAALFSRDQALSVASHDLRSPLNAMHSWAYVLERQLPAGDASLQRALAIASAPVPLAELLDEVASLARVALADARGTRVDTRFKGAPGATLLADPERLAQALWTLAVFAIEAAASGSTVTLACDALHSADSVGFELAFTAEPDAIVDASLPHAIDPGARREALLERDGRRPPWAVALCQRVALAHGGSFTALELAAGSAARNTLTLPRKAGA